MARWTPDPSFYPSPKLAMEAPKETIAYVALLEPDQASRPDALGVIDLERGLGHIWDTRCQLGKRKPPPERGFPEADEGTRTLDLLHGKQTL